MKLDRRIALAALFAFASLLPLPSPSPVVTAHAASLSASDVTRSAAPERWWGVVAAVTCGASIKLVTVVGPQPAVIAVAIGSCTLALFDVIST